MLSTKKLPEVNAGSMADIAFLLLVFFLVTTTMQQDLGLRVSLPQWTDEIGDDIKETKNVLRVVVTASDQLFVNEERFDIEMLKEKALRFVTNNGKDPSMSESPQLAIVFITSDNGCSYDRYLQVSNEIYAAYNELWEQMARQDYGRSWNSLTAADQWAIKAKIPQTIAEKETEF